MVETKLDCKHNTDSAHFGYEFVMTNGALIRHTHTFTYDVSHYHLLGLNMSFLSNLCVTLENRI